MDEKITGHIKSLPFRIFWKIISRMKPLLLSICLTLHAIACLSADYDYMLTWLAPNTHTFVVELTVSQQSGEYTDFKMPAWRPGRYILQDYAAGVTQASAFDGQKKPLRWQKTDKDTWRVFHSGSEKITLRYLWYANNPDAGSSLLTENEVYINPVNLCMYVPGRMEGSVQLSLPQLPADWKAATALRSAGSPGVYVASSYHEFADMPMVFSPLVHTLKFVVLGNSWTIYPPLSALPHQTTFYIHLIGAYTPNAAIDQAILTSVEKICREQAALFGKDFPFENYHFIYRFLSGEMRHAVEHSNSASFALPLSVLTTPETAAQGLAGITAHEFFHVWNVKRIRPAAMWPYDYSGPQYTRLQWFTEGVTEYYTQLTLVRAGLITQEQYLTGLARSLQGVENNPANQLISPAEASFNSWLDPSPYANPLYRTSYYSIGAKAGLLLDLELRQRSEGKVSLDSLFTYLYLTYALQQQGVPEDGIQLAAEAISGTSFQAFFERYVYGTAAPDYEKVFQAFGVSYAASSDASGLRALGIVQIKELPEGWQIQRIAPGSDAWLAGLDVNDIVLEIDGKSVARQAAAEFKPELKKGRTYPVVLLRNGSSRTLDIPYEARFLPLTITLTAAPNPGKQEQKRLAQWLDSRQK